MTFMVLFLKQKEVISMIVYIDFYIDTKTNEIHQFGCNHMPVESNTYLGIYKNRELALTNAKSKGFMNASTCNSCNI